VTGLTHGSSISGARACNADQQESTAKSRVSTSAATTSDAIRQIIGADNLATSVSNDSYNVANNVEFAKDISPGGSKASLASIEFGV
jgi:hypothetical protein